MPTTKKNNTAPSPSSDDGRSNANNDVAAANVLDSFSMDLDSLASESSPLAAVDGKSNDNYGEEAAAPSINANDAEKEEEDEAADDGAEEDGTNDDGVNRDAEEDAPSPRADAVVGGDLAVNDEEEEEEEEEGTSSYDD